jgi:multiple sugar transport system permease protein
MHSRWTKYIVLSPALAIVLVTVAYPLGSALLTSFRDWNLGQSLEPGDFVGLANYAQAFQDPIFLNSIRVSTLYTLMTVTLSLTLALGMALVLQGPGLVKTVAKVLLILPYAVAPALKGFSWRFMLNDSYGVYDGIITTLLPFTRDIVWLGSTTWALFWMAMSEVWGWAPLIALMFIGALGGVSPEVQEAARVDGANRRQILWRVTLPMMRPVIVIAALLQAIFSIKMFDQVVTMTGGGPGRSTQTINYVIFQQGFNFLDMGYASAQAVILVVGVTVVAGVYGRTIMREGAR